jgi:hypothetical protein
MSNEKLKQMPHALCSNSPGAVCAIGIGGLIDGLQIGGKRLAILPTHIIDDVRIRVFSSYYIHIIAHMIAHMLLTRLLASQNPIFP